MSELFIELPDQQQELISGGVGTYPSGDTKSHKPSHGWYGNYGSHGQMPMYTPPSDGGYDYGEYHIPGPGYDSY